MMKTNNQLDDGKTLRLVGVLYPGTQRVFVLADGCGDYYIRREGEDILNPTAPFHQYPSTRSVTKFLKTNA